MTMVAVKPCGTCGATDRFPSGKCRPCTNRRNADRGEYKQAWAKKSRAANPEEWRAKDKIRRERRSEARREEHQCWRQANPEYFRKWRSQNRDSARTANKRWRESNPEAAREARRRWRQANWPKVLNQLQQRRARRRNARGSFTLTQARARFDYYGGRCWMCQAEATCMDHFIALCNGGSNWPANLRPACARCNGAKGNWEMTGPKTVAEILIKARDFRKDADQ